MATQDAWTIGQLGERVAAALSGYPGQANGRVREVPDPRTIRWYVTIGLVDRPGAVRGRAARYGPRHLLQLVAIKHRQAQGRTLAEIQAELAGATDSTLRAIAAVPEELLAPSGDTAVATARPDRFWTVLPADPPAEPRWRERPRADVALVHGVRLSTGVTLFLSEAGRVPDERDVAALRAAAAPLLRTLADRGLHPIPNDGPDEPGGSDDHA